MSIFSSRGNFKNPSSGGGFSVRSVSTVSSGGQSLLSSVAVLLPVQKAVMGLGLGVVVGGTGAVFFSGAPQGSAPEKFVENNAELAEQIESADRRQQLADAESPDGSQGEGGFLQNGGDGSGFFSESGGSGGGFGSGGTGGTGGLGDGSQSGGVGNFQGSGEVPASFGQAASEVSEDEGGFDFLGIFDGGDEGDAQSSGSDGGGDGSGSGAGDEDRSILSFFLPFVETESSGSGGASGTETTGGSNEESAGSGDSDGEEWIGGGGSSGGSQNSSSGSSNSGGSDSSSTNGDQSPTDEQTNEEEADEGGDSGSEDSDEPEESETDEEQSDNNDGEASNANSLNPQNNANSGGGNQQLLQAIAQLENQIDNTSAQNNNQIAQLQQNIEDLERLMRLQQESQKEQESLTEENTLSLENRLRRSEGAISSLAEASQSVITTFETVRVLQSDTQETKDIQEDILQMQRVLLGMVGANIGLTMLCIVAVIAWRRKTPDKRRF